MNVRKMSSELKKEVTKIRFVKLEIS